MGNYFDEKLLCDRCLPLWQERDDRVPEAWWERLEDGDTGICRKCSTKLLTWVNDDEQ